MSEWIQKTIGELCDLGGGKVKTGPFGSQLHQSDYQEEGIPVVMPTNIINGSIDIEKIARVSENHVERLYKHKLSKGDIVYGRRGDIGRQALVKNNNIGWLCGSGCLRISMGNSEVIPEYLHLYLQMPEIIRWILNQAIGATMPNLNTQILRRVPIYFPPTKEEQKKITSIIFAYDDIIENNKSRIALLENMAEEIYREWFVRFRFPGYQQAKFEKGIPVEWEQGTLSQIVNLLMGQSPKSKYYNDTGDGLPFHQGVGTYGNRYPINKTFCSISGRKAKEGSILFSVRAPVGRLNIANTDMIIGRGLAALNHKLDYNSYLYYLLRTVFSNEDIIGNGSIFNSVCKNDLQKFRLLIPKTALIKDFDENISKIDRQIDVLESSNEILEKTKKSLLGRLISGKLSVEDLDIQFPPSML